MRHCCTTVVEADLRFKHRQMRKEPFLFFRATFYRWAQLWPDLCADLRHAPKVLAVEDLHVGSFGTWRDEEGRLCWGVDDFDESWPLPYTNDLVRLAASAKIVADVEQLSINVNDSCDTILDGYVKSLRSGGEPFVLAEREQYMENWASEPLSRRMASGRNWHTSPWLAVVFPGMQGRRFVKHFRTRISTVR